MKNTDFQEYYLRFLFGNITKYLESTLSLAEKYSLPAYLKQTLELTKLRIESEFGKDEDKQAGLGKWF